MSEQKTQVDNIITLLKNNRVVAILIVFGITIIAISSFTDATHKIIKQIQGFFSDRPAVVTLRHKPKILSSDVVKVLLAKHGFYEKRWNPSGKGIAHRYESQIRDNAVILLDAATGLMWEKGGSSDRMTFADAEQYVHRINAEKFAGFNDWRLPTVEEAMSLMEPQAYDRFHIDPEFERGINFIWTSDRATDGRIWMLYFYDGMLNLEPDSYNAWVRVVR
ncbi:DUF1566 domain-containing protein [candidate division KSB1 bacterium]|nr:DUF1566 domain-containing protein [candidate division KSB1 bacterium]